ncbi:hypothetical protein IKA15_02075 [bacterium]|nr:hypothetical protein [bacterium]
MAEIRITYNPETIKNVSNLNGLKGKNLVANHVFTNENWLDSNEQGKNSTDHKISGDEFLNFAKHIDRDGDCKITDKEMEDWRKANKEQGLKVHDSFSDKEIMELFGMVFNEANSATGKNNAGQVHSPDSSNGSGNNNGSNGRTGYDSTGATSDRETLMGQNYDIWANTLDLSRVVDDGTAQNNNNQRSTTDPASTVTKAEDTTADKKETVSYDTTSMAEVDKKGADAVKEFDKNTLLKLKNTNLVAQNIYAHEEWLDKDEKDGKATNQNVNGEISGEELAAFAKHVDQNNDGKIDYNEFTTWRDANINVGNKAHANFTYAQVMEVLNVANQYIKSTQGK